MFKMEHHYTAHKIIIKNKICHRIRKQLKQYFKETNRKIKRAFLLSQILFDLHL